ncbi:MAG TPA: hypothetical protein VJ970_07045, partial [Flavobacteriaceae bacterium]|nr:hypothetical protein [Flavobacteriaceae bacterium]
FRYVGGQPYTPYDLESSSKIENYNIADSGILDYSKLKTERYSDFHQLDLRIDKTWFWNKLSLNFYIDIQNVYGNEFTSQPYLIPEVDANGNNVIDENDSSKYILEEIKNNSGTVLPSFGFILDF